MPFRATTFRLSQRVSPVFTLSILPMAPMSPQVSSLTSSAFLPHILYSRPSFSVSPVRALTRARSEVISPERTLMREYLPYWSEMVLNT